jgi:hypothetical protein
VKEVAETMRNISALSANFSTVWTIFGFIEQIVSVFGISAMTVDCNLLMKAAK